MTAPHFTPEFRTKLTELLAWRRDVRRFLTHPVPRELLERLLDDACLAPSVGNSQPWRFVLVESAGRRQAVQASFLQANAEASELYSGERRALYDMLKLEGLSQAPIHLAVCCDERSEQGLGLGRQTMPETLAYSTVCAIHTLWLAARSHGLGMGWLSIVNPAIVSALLDLPEHWKLVAYLCLGYPEAETTQPELERAGWQSRRPECRILHVR